MTLHPGKALQDEHILGWIPIQNPPVHNKITTEAPL